MNKQSYVRAHTIATLLIGIVVPSQDVTAQGRPQISAPGYPLRAVRFIIPYPTGGPTDITARIVAQKLSDALGQQFIVDNRGGGSGIIGTELAARASADGYTLLCVGIPHALSPALYEKLPYNVLNDFEPVARFVSYANILVVHPGVPAKSVKELIALAKASPGKLNFAVGGSGSSLRLAAELFKVMAAVDIVNIPYQGSAQAMTEVLAGQVTIMFGTTLGALPHIKSGKVRALAVTSLERSPFTPNLPTIAESGLPGFEVNSWVGMVAPAKTPAAIRGKLHSTVIDVLQLPDVRERIAALGAVPAPSTPEEFGEYLKGEIAKWAKIVRDSGMKAD